MSGEPFEPTEQKPKKLVLQCMLLSLSLRIGGSFGAEDLVTATYTDGSSETMTTAGGVNIFAGVTLTPLRFGSHALGVGFEAGWKGSSIGSHSDANIWMHRNVFAPRLQYGYELTPAINWVFAGGLQYETGIELGASGAVTGGKKFDSALGYFGETGLLMDFGYFGMDLTMRHTWLNYGSGGTTLLDADSTSILLGLYVGILRSPRPANAARSD